MNSILDINQFFKIDTTFTPSKLQLHYRNNANFNFNTQIQNSITSKISIDIATRFKSFIQSYNSTKFNVFGIIVKESKSNSNKQIMIILKIFSETNNIPIPIASSIIEFLLQYNISSIYYQLNSKSSDNHTTHHLYGTHTITHSYIINNHTFYTHNHPFAFCRINHPQANIIYQQLYNTIIKNKLYSIICTGRDVSIPSQILAPHFSHTHILTHSKDVELDLRLNQYPKNTLITITPKHTIPNYINSITQNTIIILTASRKGISKPFIQAIINNKFIKQVIYIACNHNTMINNIKHILPYYKLHNISINDEFPNTNYTNIILSIIPK